MLKNIKLNNILESILNEGVYDPGILKAVFLAGGPGSGKSYSASKIFGIDDNIMKGTSTLGLKVLNSDTAFERILKDRGVDPKNLALMTDKVLQYYTAQVGSPRFKAKEQLAKLKAIYENGRLGLIVDGTGKDVAGINKYRSKLITLGYDTAMVFINTSIKAALERNRKRDRVLPDTLVKQAWEDVQHNIGEFQSIFGSNFYIVDNTEIGNFNKMHGDKIKAVEKFIKSPIKNHIGKQWVENELKIKNALKSDK